MEGDNNTGAPLNTSVDPHANIGGQVAPLGTVQAPPVPATAPAPSMAPQVKEPSPEDIGRTIAKPAAPSAEVANGPSAEVPKAFDISTLRPEQLQELKALLLATPDKANVKKTNPIVTLRRFTALSKEGGQPVARLVTDFKNAFETYVRDDVANTTRETVMIPIHFFGDPADKWTNVPYKEFIGSDQVRCEVISTRTEPGRIVEGEVLSRETGRIVEREVKTLLTWFTIKLPEGYDPNTIEIEARLANA